MVCLTVTPAIQSALEALYERGVTSVISDDPELDPLVGRPISHHQVLQISRYLQQLQNQVRHPNQLPSYHLDELLRGSQVYIEPPKPRNEPTTEYKALMARLRREEEDRAYERMINPPPPAETFPQRFPSSSYANLFPKTQEDVGEDDEITYADINRQMALIINILISIVACSVAIWLAARHWSTPSRLGLSMGGSGAVAVAEAVVYAGYVRRLKEAREKGKKEIEIKEIIKTWVIGGDEKTEQTNAIPNKPSGTRDGNLRRRKSSRK